MGDCCSKRDLPDPNNIPPTVNNVDIVVDLGGEEGIKKMSCDLSKKIADLADAITAYYKVENFTLKLDEEVLKNNKTAGE